MQLLQMVFLLFHLRLRGDVDDLVRPADRLHVGHAGGEPGAVVGRVGEELDPHKVPRRVDGGRGGVAAVAADQGRVGAVAVANLEGGNNGTSFSSDCVKKRSK